MDRATRSRALGRQSDEQLSRRLAQGEAAAFDELYRRYRHRLAAYGAHLLGDGAAGEDVAQVALLNAHQALLSGKQPERVRPWLYRIAHNAALDLLDPRVLPVAEPRPPDSETAAPDTPAGPLVAALARLSDQQRRVYLLRELHGLRIAEIAAMLALTAGQVEQVLFAARNGLAETLAFGERLGCEAVRRLSAGPLDAREQRALQRHLRACPSCRELAPKRRPLVLLPLLPLDWLRRPVARLQSWSSAAKVGALGATALVAAAAPVAAPRLHHHRAATPPTPARSAPAGPAREAVSRKDTAPPRRAGRPPAAPTRAASLVGFAAPVVPTPTASVQAATSSGDRRSAPERVEPAEPVEQPEAPEAG